ncbi:MAG: ATP-binding cassette domain-containing protein [Candidatus Heimdallarchaeota archaeon]
MIECNDVIKIYTDQETKSRIAALRGIDMSIGRGELVSIIGPSGSGKSTLIKILAGIEAISSGEVIVGGHLLANMTIKELLRYRLKNVGLVHQFPERTLFLGGTIADNLTFSSSYLSGGEMIRTAIACMLAKNAKLLLCDEPTGQLDSENTNRVKDYLRRVSRDFNATVLVVTHDLRFLHGVDRTCEIHSGRVSSLVNAIDSEIQAKPTFPIDFVGQIDSTQSVRIPTNIYSMLKLEKNVKFRITEDSEVKIIHPKGLPPKTFELGETRKLKKLVVKPNGENYFNEKEIEIMLESVSKIYKQKAADVHAVDGVDLKIFQGEFVFVIGPSGSGKTTLIKLITGMETTSTGKVHVCGNNLEDYNDTKRAKFRRDNLGIVSQQGDLHPTITVKQNLFLRDIIAGKFVSLKEIPSNELDDIFNMFEIGHRQDSFPLEISGGELQRASLAIAKYGEPRILILDEPTANMDAELAANVMTRLYQLHKRLGVTLIITTHDINLVKDGTRIIELEDGKIKRDGLAFSV